MESLTQSNDFTAAVAATRQYWGSEHEHNDAELFARARCQWEGAKGEDTATREFVLQVVACRLEEQLLLWLLQFHASDAAERMQTLFEVCSDSYFTTEGLELLSPVLDTLLTAAVSRAAACDRSAENRKRRIAEMVEKVNSSALMSSEVRSVVRALVVANEDGGAWKQFLDLPSELETRLFNSRSGRAFLDEVQQVVTLQQVEMNAAFGECERCDSLETEEQMPTADVLWTLAEKLVEMVTAQAETEKDAQTLSSAGFDTTGTSLVVENVTDLEGYLEAKESVTATGLVVQEVMASRDDENLSAIEQLSETYSSLNGEPVISSGLLEKVFDEMSAVTNLDILSVHASFLISLQMRARHCFVDRNESAKAEFERRIRRAFNRLTGKVRDLDHAASLIALAAFRPSQVIQQFVRGARTDVLHHKLYLKVLRESPLLLDWNEASEGGTTFLEYELQQNLVELSTKQSCFDRESQNMISFLLSLVGLSNGAFSKHEKPLMTITNLLSGVLNPLYSILSSGGRTTHSMEMQLNLYSLIQQLLQAFVTAGAGSRIDSAVVESSFGYILLALHTTESRGPGINILIRERLLLQLKNIMELMDEPATITTRGWLNTPLNPSVWTLLGLFNNELGSDKLCTGLEDVTVVEAYLQASPEEKRIAPVRLLNVISAVRVLLWGLLWDSVLAVSASVESTKTETWSLLDIVAEYEFPQPSSAAQTVKGSLLIQSAVAEMMLECGSVIFQALYTSIIPYLLEYESIEANTLPEEIIIIPEWTAEKLPKQPEFDLQLSCRLQSTHSAMRYVAKCWGISCAASTHLATASNPLLVESLSHVLSALDQATTSSEKSLSCSLFCIQWLCLLASAAYELRLDAISTWSTVRTQTELSLLRLLNQLSQLRGAQTESREAHFSQYFVAAWLAYLPAGQFEQAFNFLASRRNN